MPDGKVIHDFSFGKILLRFKKRYEAYLNDEHKQFPHEMGLLLGYPIEDVRGFIEHNGCGCLYSGYWKVYRNVPLKKKMFEDFEKAKSEKDKTIHILHFTDLNSIRPIYYDKTYHAVPEAGGDKAFELLRKAMKDENKVAVAKTVMGTKEKLLTLIPTDDGILIETMFFADEVKQVPKEPAPSGETVKLPSTASLKSLSSILSRGFFAGLSTVIVHLTPSAVSLASFIADIVSGVKPSISTV